MFGSTSSSLESATLLVRPMRTTDVCEAYLNTLNDKSYMRYSRQRELTHSRQTACKYISDLRESQGEIFACFDRWSLDMVATVTVRFSEDGAEAHMGLLTLHSHGGTGRGLESWTTVLKWVCEIPSINTVRAGTHASNKAMQRILKRSGFQEIPPENQEPSVRKFALTCGNCESPPSPRATRAPLTAAL